MRAATITPEQERQLIELKVSSFDVREAYRPLEPHHTLEEMAEELEILVAAIAAVAPWLVALAASVRAAAILSPEEVPQ